VEITGQITEHDELIFKFDDIEINLTTNHSASSYGIPIAVIDGIEYGPGDYIEIDGNMCKMSAIFKGIKAYIDKFLLQGEL